MEEQVAPLPQMLVPLGRTLLPEEVAENKAKGREWSQIVKGRSRKLLTPQEVEDRRLKNRLRQKRFRERQKSKEAEEEARVSTNTYHTALGAHHAQMTVQHGQHSLEHHAYPPEPEAAYEAVQQEEQAAVEVEAEAETEPPADMSLTDNRGESLAEKRKRLGRERQARFREKKRARSMQGGEQMVAGEDSGSPVASRQPESSQIADLQKLSAQLSGYYLGLTQGLSQEEHHAVMKFFLDNLREDLGDEVVSGVANYMFVDAHTAAAAAAAAQAHAQYMHHGIVQGLAQQGIDLQTFQAAAAAQQDLQDHLHQQHQLGQEQHVPEHMQAQLEHMGMLPQANQVLMAKNDMAGVEAQLDYHRQVQQAEENVMKALLKADNGAAGNESSMGDHHLSNGRHNPEDGHNPVNGHGTASNARDLPEQAQIDDSMPAEAHDPGGHALNGHVAGVYDVPQVHGDYDSLAAPQGYADEQVHAQYAVSRVAPHQA